MALFRQRDAQLTGGLIDKESVGNRCSRCVLVNQRCSQKHATLTGQNAAAVAIPNVGTTGTTMRHIAQHIVGVADYLVRAITLDMHDKANATSVLFEFWVVESLSLRNSGGP